MMVKLSIVMATYDDEAYLPSAIQAFLSQSFSDFELIIVNDASPDHSEKIIKQFASVDPRIRYVKNEKNLGVNKSLNKGAEIIQGEYVYFASSDDFVAPNFFKEMLALLEKNPKFPLALSENAYFNDGNEEEFHIRKLLPELKEPTLFSAKEALNIFQTTRFLISGHATIIKTEEFKKRGFFKDELGKATDFVMYNAIALSGGFIFIPKRLSAMRSFPKDAEVKRKEEITQAIKLLSYVKRDKELFSLFYSSTLLARAIRSPLFTLFFRPKFWDIFFPMMWMKGYLFFRKFSKKGRPKWVVDRV